MHCVAGIDPGVTGAVAVLCEATDRPGPPRLAVYDFPTLKVPIGRTMRKRADAPALITLLTAIKFLGVNLALLEDVGGITGQSASASFVFGQCCGYAEAGIITARLPLQLVTPQTWQKKFGVKGKTYKERKQSARLAASRAFPEFTDWGCVESGRADAALIALYAARYIQSWA